MESGSGFHLPSVLDKRLVGRLREVYQGLPVAHDRQQRQDKLHIAIVNQ